MPNCSYLYFTIWVDIFLSYSFFSFISFTLYFMISVIPPGNLHPPFIFVLTSYSTSPLNATVVPRYLKLTTSISTILLYSICILPLISSSTFFLAPLFHIFLVITWSHSLQNSTIQQRNFSCASTNGAAPSANSDSHCSHLSFLYLNPNLYHALFPLSLSLYHTSTSKITTMWLTELRLYL